MGIRPLRFQWLSPPPLLLTSRSLTCPGEDKVLCKPQGFCASFLFFFLWFRMLRLKERCWEASIPRTERGWEQRARLLLRGSLVILISHLGRKRRFLRPCCFVKCTVNLDCLVKLILSHRSGGPIYLCFILSESFSPPPPHCYQACFFPEGRSTMPHEHPHGMTAGCSHDKKSGDQGRDWNPFYILALEITLSYIHSFLLITEQ